MSNTRSRPPALARFLLELRPLGKHRADLQSDLNDLFAQRIADRGVRYARRRYLVDVLSLWFHRQPATEGEGMTRLGGRRAHPLEGVGDDVKFAFRVFRRQAGIVSVAIGGLALAIGLVTTVFSITNAFNFRPLGVADPDAVVRISRTTGLRGTVVGEGTFADYLRLREAARLVTIEASVEAYSLSLAAESGVSANGRGINARFVTGTFVQTFGGRAMLGRVLEPSDDVPGAPAVAAIHYAFWKSRLDGDRSIIGRTIYLEGSPVTVVGVFDRSFSGPFPVTTAPSILLPLAASAAIVPTAGPFHPSSPAPVSLIGRLVRPATLTQAAAEVSAIAANLDGASAGIRTIPAGISMTRAGNEFTLDDLALLAIFMTIVGLVLLLAATNVANVLLASATTRQQEIGARLALGASRSRIARQLVTESVVLGAIAGAAGLIVAMWLTPVAVSLLRIPPSVDVPVDVRVCLFVTLMSALVGVVVGQAPARFGSRGDVLSALKGGTMQAGAAPRGGRMRTAFLGVQAAASVMLLVLSALFGRALIKASTPDFEFDIDRLVSVTAFGSRDGGTMPSQQFWDAALERVRALPGVERAALVRQPPFADGFAPAAMTLNGERYPLVVNTVSVEYFDTVGFRLLQGRTFTAAEIASKSPVAVITAGVARDFWPEGNVVGSSLGRMNATNPYYTNTRVIGVVSDAAAMVGGPNYWGAGVIYRPIENIDDMTMVIRTASASATPVRVLQEAIAAIDPARRPRVAPIRAGLEELMTAPRILASITAIIGGLALVLAVIGVFGVTAFVVGQRRREISIRMAIGASRRDVIRIVFTQGMRPVVAGLVAGVILALLASPLIGWALYARVSARDPLAYAAATAILLIAATAGVLLPARRASRVDPAAVLKEQ